MDRVVIKTLSKNDLGISGSHQAGILVPKSLVKQAFFPPLDESRQNPNCPVSVVSGEKKYELNFVHYNSRVFGTGTRNEYRLTRLSQFFKDNDCSLGDRLVFSFNIETAQYSLSVERQRTQSVHLKYSIEHPLVIHANWEF